jgi:hypothetical protein
MAKNYEINKKINNNESCLSQRYLKSYKKNAKQNIKTNLRMDSSIKPMVVKKIME